MDHRDARAGTTLLPHLPSRLPGHHEPNNLDRAHAAGARA